MSSNEEQHLEVLYKQAFPEVARMVSALGGDMETARDLFHDAVIIYLEKEREGMPDIHVSPKAYLKGITRMLWLHHFRDSRQYLSLDDTLHDIAIPADFYDTGEQYGSLPEHLKAAGDKCLRILKAFYYDRLSMEQIATQFNYKTTHSATVQKYKCIEKVREQVKTQLRHEEIA